jgi:hypothetical protein
MNEVTETPEKPVSIRGALLAMGYHELEPGKWLKPIGYQAFTFCESKSEWANWFISEEGKIALWDARNIDPSSDCILGTLRSWECFTRKDFHYYGEFSFELRMREFLGS